MASGKLPDGYAFSSATGTISGTSFDAGVYANLTVNVRDKDTETTTAPFRIAVQPSPWSASVAPSPTGVTGQPFTLVPTASGFPQAPRWSVVVGSAPAFATFSAADGRISGTPQAPGIARGIRLQADDGQGRIARTALFDIGIFDQRNLGISLPRTAEAYVNTPFALRPQATNSDGGEAWTVASGEMPPWMAMDPATGVLSGTPTQVGTASFAVKVVDRNARQATGETLVVTVSEPRLALGAVRSPLVVPYNETFASGAVPVSYAFGNVSFAHVLGTLPAGLSVDAATGGVKGIVRSPSDIRTFGGIVVEATDETTARRRTAAFDVRVERPVLTTIGIPGTTNAYVDMQVTLQPPAVKGAVGAVSYTAEGAPPWLTFDAATGRLRGTPTEVGTYGPIVYTATDAYDGSSVKAPAYQVQVNPAPRTVYASLAKSSYTGRVGVAFASEAPVAHGIGAPVTWSLQGETPAGLRLNTADGTVSGTPTVAGSASVTFVATDPQGRTASSDPVAFRVLDVPVLSVSGTSVRSMAPFRGQGSARNLAGQPTYTLAGAPAWIAFDRSSGTMTGRAPQSGTFRNLILSLVDVDGARASLSFDVTVSPGIAVTGLAASYPGRVGKAIAPVTPDVSGAKGAVGWGVTEKTQPPSGISVSGTTGTVSGTPTQAGSVSLTATDASDGATAEGVVNLALAPALAVRGNLGFSTHVCVDATGPLPGIVGQRGDRMTFDVVNGTLPPFATLQRQTGSITMRSPPLSSTPGLVLRMTDPVDNATADSDPFTLSVLPAPVVDGMATLYTAQYGKPFVIHAPTLRNAIGSVAWGLQGKLPPWALQLSDGSISGANPDAFGTTRGLSVKGTDSTGLSASSAEFDLKVVSAPVVSVSSREIKGRVGTPFTVTASTGASAAVPVWTLLTDSGALPTGVTFDAANATVGGLPGATGSASVRFHVEETIGQGSETSQPVSIEVAGAFSLSMSDGPARSYTTRTTRNFTSGTPVPSGAGGAIAYALSPALPQGMNAFPAATGVLSGIPYAPFPRTTFTITGLDAFDNATASVSYSLEALAPVAVTASNDVVLRSGVDASTLAISPKATNLTDPAAVRWDLDGTSGMLPQGITVDASTGRLKGSATVAARADFAGIKLRATDVDGTAGVSPAPFTVTIAPALSASVDKGAYDGRFGIARTTGKVVVANALSAVPGYALVTKSGTGPAVPPTINSDGSFTLTPDTGMSAAWTYVVRVTDSDGSTAETGPVTWSTTSNPQVALSVPATVYQSQYLVVTPTISNTQGAITASWTTTPPATIVPTGTGKLDAATGSFTIKTSGGLTPNTTYGPYTLNVRDGTGQIGSATFSVKALANTLAVSSPTSGQALQWHQSSDASYQAALSGNSGAVTWSRIQPGNTANGSGPGNLSIAPGGAIQLNQSTLLGATPSTVYAVDATGQWTAASFTAAVVGPLTSTVSASASTATESVAITPVTASTSANIGAVTWTLTGAPDGVVATPSGTNNANVTVSGTPGPNTGKRTYDMTLSAADTKGGSVAKAIALTVLAPPLLALDTVAAFTQDGLADTTCRDVRLTNSGEGNATGLVMSVTGSTEFSTCAPAQSPACTTSLAACASCWTAVTLKGTSSGTKTATLNAKPANGIAATATLSGNTANVLAAGYVVVSLAGTRTVTLPRPGISGRILAIGAGSSGGNQGSFIGGYTAFYTSVSGSSGMLAYSSVDNLPQTLTVTVGAGGVGATPAGRAEVNDPTSGGATSVAGAGIATVTAAGGTSAGGGSGGGAVYATSNYSFNGTAGGSNGNSGAAPATGSSGYPARTGQGPNFAAFLAAMRVSKPSAAAVVAGFIQPCGGGQCPTGTAGAGAGVYVNTSAAYPTPLAYSATNGNTPGTASNGTGTSAGRAGGGLGGAGGNSTLTLCCSRYGYDNWRGGTGSVGGAIIEWDAQ
jgi:hypothetical protein